MKTFLIIIFSAISLSALSQDNKQKPKPTVAANESVVVSEKDSEKKSAVPVVTTKSATPVAAELKAVEEKPLKNENPKH